MDFKMEWSDQVEDAEVLQKNLLEAVSQKFGSFIRQKFMWVIRDDECQVMAGISGVAHWNWAYISHLWVDANYQGRGLGSQLLEVVEQWARSQKLNGVYLDTFEVRVQKFYEARGYKTVGGIPDFPTKGGQRIYLCRPF